MSTSQCLLALVCVSGGMCAGCGDVAERSVRIVRTPTVDSECGLSGDAATMRVFGLGRFSASTSSVATFQIESDSSFSIGDFPAATAQLGFEVLDSAGEVVSVGTSDAFDPESPPEEISVFMAREFGACEVESLPAPRESAKAVVLGDDAVIIGGGDGEEPSMNILRFSATQNRFEGVSIVTYATAIHGLIGASATAVGDRVAIVGGGATAWQMIESDYTSSGANFLSEARAHHAAVALSATEVLLMGGCPTMNERSECPAGSALTTSSILNTDTGQLSPGPNLRTARVGGIAALIGGEVLLTGGVDGSGEAVVDGEWLRVGPGTSVLAAGLGGVVGPTAAGGGVVASPEAGGTTTVRLVSQIARTGEVIAGVVGTTDDILQLHDGAVLTIGDGVAAIEPAAGIVRDVDVPAALFGRAAVRLRDGSVLLGGGRDGGSVVAQAWRIRPSIVGPRWNRDINVQFGSADAVHPLVATGGLTFAAGLGRIAEGEWAVVAGPKYREGALSARVAAGAGMVGLLWFVSPVQHHRVELAIGGTARIVEVAGGEESVVCSGETLSAGALGSADTPVVVDIVFGQGRVTVHIDEGRVLDCGGFGAAAEGAVGIGAQGGPIVLSNVSARR